MDHHPQLQDDGPPPRHQHQRSVRGRKMSLPATFSTASRNNMMDDHAEYCINVDRPAYVLSTPDDGSSLSDRQCYVRSHFVEVFVAGLSDVGARHSRGAQKLNLGQVGLRCAYCVTLKARDRAERAVCYPSSISRIYQTVADMQRFHFESCAAIPPRVLHAYKSLKTTRPRGQGSPQSYWDRSARDIGLVDTDDGIQVARGLLSCGRRAADVFELQRKSVITGMLARMDGHDSHDVGQGAMIMQGMMQGQGHMMREEETAYHEQQVLPSSEQLRSGNGAIPSAIVSSPGSGTSPGSNADHNHGVEHHSKNMSSSPGSDPGVPGALSTCFVTPKESLEAEDDANILLMLKKTPESPPKYENSEEFPITSGAAAPSTAPVNEDTKKINTTVNEDEPMFKEAAESLTKRGSESLVTLAKEASSALTTNTVSLAMVKEVSDASHVTAKKLVLNEESRASHELLDSAT